MKKSVSIGSLTRSNPSSTFERSRPRKTSLSKSWLTKNQRAEEKKGAISKTMRDTIDYSTSTHLNLQKGIDDIRCSYQPDFGYAQGVQLPRRDGYWDTIADCVLNPFAPTHSTVLSAMQDKAIKILHKIDASSARSSSSIRQKALRDTPSSSHKLSLPAKSQSLSRSMHQSSCKSVDASKKRPSSGSQMDLMMLFKDDYKETFKSDIPSEIEERFENLKGILEKINANHRRNKRNFQQVRKNYKGTLEEDNISEELSRKQTSSSCKLRVDESPKMTRSFRVKQEHLAKSQSNFNIPHQPKPMRPSEPRLNRRQARSTVPSCESTPMRKPKTQSCFPSIRNSPVKESARKNSPSKQAEVMDDFVLKFSQKFQERGKSKSKKVKLGVINELVLKGREQVIRKIKERERQHKQEAKERWLKVKYEVEKIKRKQLERELRQALAASESRPVQKLSQNIDYEPSLPELEEIREESK